MRTVIQYRWLYRDKITGLLIKTRYWATQEDMQRIDTDAERIPWSKRRVEIPDEPLMLAAGRRNRGEKLS